jgi:hypothetical protein
MRTIGLFAIAGFVMILVGVAVRAATTPEAKPVQVENFRGATPVGTGMYVLPPVY